MARLDPGILAGGTLWIVGCGNMGRAMLDRWVACGLEPAKVTVIDPALPVVGQGVTVLAAPEADMPPPSVLLLAVKPQMLDVVAAAIAPRVARETLLVSILAGVTISTLRARFPVPANLARAMPNLPVAIGAGVVALYGVAGQPEAARLDALMAPLGVVEWLGAEAHFDAVTALSGSGPAFVARFIEAMAAGGAALGLPETQAARMALATVGGTAALLETSGEAPAAMAKRVTSPNGTTQAGLAVLDEKAVFATRVAATLAAAARRSAELNPPAEAQ
jgi:pyrroline-5-carboxylate reductase